MSFSTEQREGTQEHCACTCGKKFCASNRKSVADSDKKWLQQKRENHRARYRRTQEATTAGASRNYAVWTSVELELLERQDINSSDVAQMTGRTLAAVYTMRRKLRREPKLQRVIEFERREGRL